MLIGPIRSFVVLVVLVLLVLLVRGDFMKICLLDCIRVMIKLAYTVFVFHNVLWFLPTLST